MDFCTRRAEAKVILFITSSVAAAAAEEEDISSCEGGEAGEGTWDTGVLGALAAEAWFEAAAAVAERVERRSLIVLVQR